MSGGLLILLVVMGPWVCAAICGGLALLVGGDSVIGGIIGVVISLIIWIVIFATDSPFLYIEITGREI